MIQRCFLVLQTTTRPRIIAGLQLAAEASQGEFVSFFCHVWCVCWVKGVLLNVEGRSLSRNTWPYCSCYTSIVDPPYSMPNKTGGSPAVLLDIESSGRIQQTKPQEVQYLDVWDTADGSEIPNNHLE